jgi:hypothetical protein
MQLETYRVKIQVAEKFLLSVPQVIMRLIDIRFELLQGKRQGRII